MEVSSDTLWTAVWHLQQDPPQDEAALELLRTILGHPKPSGSKEPTDRDLDGQKLLRCPFAVTQGLPNSRTRGKYSKGYPEGAIIHFTAGHQNQAPKDALAFQVKKGHTYFLIDRDGNIYQNFPLDRWGYHAGASKWDGFRDGVNDNLVGIEVMCPGKLNSVNQPWYGGTPIHGDDVRQVDGDDQIEAGRYAKFTSAQEASLERLVRWLHGNNPDVFKLDLVLGHDEVSGPRGLGWRRKNDPGGSLSSSMDDFRAKLQA